jgi:hypothetical protein
MVRRTGILVLLLVALGAGGCLRKSTVHTVYLSPDGSAKWTVEESHVYSDEEDPGARFSEEQSYIGAALIGAHPIARGLQVLTPDSLVSTTVVRDERPFHVITDARFARIDRVFERLFNEAGIKAKVALEHADGRQRLRLTLDFSVAIQERESPALALLEEFGQYRFVLTEGRFVAGGGFDTPDRATAVLSRDAQSAIDEAIEARTPIELTLSWE